MDSPVNKDARILVISSGPPVDSGGGSRRTSQLLFELNSRFGERAVAFLGRSEIAPSHRSGVDWLIHKASRAVARVHDRLENPFQLLANGYGFSRHPGKAEANYRGILSRLPNIKICIIEHLEFAPFHQLHAELGIRTILAPWFVGSLTLQAPYFVPALRRVRSQQATSMDRVQVRAAYAHLANEILLAAAVERSWFPSRVEAGFFNASGLRAGYFPYYAAGEALDQLGRLRTRRSSTTIDENLFVITGSGIDHNRISVIEFLRQAELAGFPAKARIEIVGSDYSTEEKSLARAMKQEILFRGRLPQAEFDDLLVRTRAVLVPQTCGFGVSTRVIDMLTAGIPVIADAMVSNAAGAIPGAHYAADTARGWAEAIGAALAEPAVVPAESIEPWRREATALVARELSRLEEPKDSH